MAGIAASVAPSTVQANIEGNEPMNEAPGPDQKISQTALQTAIATVAGACEQDGPASRPRRDRYRGSGRLAGRKARITGGNSGMGRAAAIAYAREDRYFTSPADRFCGVAAMLVGVLIALRCTRRWAAAHPAPAILIAGDWQGFPLRVRAPQRLARCISKCMGLILRFGPYPTPTAFETPRLPMRP